MPDQPFPIILPLPSKLESTAKTLATLDSILQPEWDYRYFSFNATWDKNQRMASMRDGGGSWYFILFANQVAGIKAHDRDAPTYKGMGVDPDLNTLLDSDADDIAIEMAKEPAFYHDLGTFFAWYNPKTGWRCPIRQDTDEDSANDLLSHLLGGPDTYHTWAEEYYERDITRKPIADIFALQGRLPSTSSVLALNPDLDYDHWLATDAKDIGLSG